MVAGVLSGDAARIRLRLDRARRRTVGTTPGSAYGGQWAGTALLRSTVPARRQVVGLWCVLPRPRHRRERCRRAASRGPPAEAGRAGRRRDRARAPAGRAGASARRHSRRPSATAPARSGRADRQRAASVQRRRNRSRAPARRWPDGRIPNRLTPPRVVLDGTTVAARRIRLRGDDAWVAFLPDAHGHGTGCRQAPRAARPPPGERAVRLHRHALVLRAIGRYRALRLGVILILSTNLIDKGEIVTA